MAGSSSSSSCRRTRGQAVCTRLQAAPPSQVPAALLSQRIHWSSLSKVGQMRLPLCQAKAHAGNSTIVRRMAPDVCSTAPHVSHLHRKQPSCDS